MSDPDDFLEEAEAEATEKPLPLVPSPPEPPTARRRLIIEKPSPPSSYIASLGQPPPDATQAAKWAFDLHLRMSYEVMTDPDLTPSQRRAELQKTLSGARVWLIDSMKYDLDKRLKEQQARLDPKKKGKAMASKEAARPAAPPSAKVIPIRAVSSDAKG